MLHILVLSADKLRVGDMIMGHSDDTRGDMGTMVEEVWVDSWGTWVTTDDGDSGYLDSKVRVERYIAE